MLLSMLLATMVALFDILFYPYVVLVDNKKRHLYHVFMSWLGRGAIYPFCKVEIKGLENIPAGEACVITGNHQSWLDPFLLAHLPINFRAAFKKELLFYPGVGQALLFTGHLWVKRGDRESGQRLIAGAERYVNEGVSFVFFPEGTRRIDPANGPLGDFKAGAFKVAVDCGARILPVTISGARTLLPPGGLPQLAYGSVCVTVHPPIATKGKDIPTLIDETKAAIITGLRDCDRL